jgi:thiol-disulfide isomerase/thioredoxin
LGAGVGFGVRFIQDRATGQTAGTAVPGNDLERIPAFSYPDLEGQLRHSSEWKDRILVLNFWAAWCPPCRAETPMFVELQQKYGGDNVRFVGIAIDDKQPVQDFVDDHGVEYPILLGDEGAITLSNKLGNHFDGLPFTVVALPGGKIILRHQGGIGRKELEPVLKQAIEASRRTFEAPERI